MKQRLSALWQKRGPEIALVLFVLLVAVLAVTLMRPKPPAVEAPPLASAHSEATQAAAQTGSAETQQETKGAARARHETTRTEPSGVVVRDVVTIECEQGGTQGQQIQGASGVEQAAKADAKVEPPKPLPKNWFRVSAGAAWKPTTTDLKPVELRAGAKVKAPWLPVWVGVEGRADPSRFKDSATGLLTVEAEWP